MLNTNQLLQLIVQKPNRSNVDIRFLSLIWEAFLRWCREQFEEKVGVKVLGMGEFCYRKDTIGDMEFLNPMFVLSESFARSFGLHDRRPKTHAVETESIELDMPAISSLATELIGEVVGKEVVEAALRDVVERIGEVCADPDAYGIITVDFGFAKLFSENKSLEFIFGETKKGGAARPDTGASAKSAASSRPKKASGMLPPIPGPGTSASVASADSMSIDGSALMQVPGMAQLKRDQAVGRASDAPLQRPHRPHIKPARNIQSVTKEDLLKSHNQQLDEKAANMEVRRDEEYQVHLNTLNRLRKEMTLDHAQQDLRKRMGKVLALHQSEQKLEKRERDVAAREVMGMDHWPFRTEEEVQSTVQKSNAVQKALLDDQLKAKRDKMEFEAREQQKKQLEQQEFARIELQLLEAERKGGRQGPTRVTAQPQYSVERTMEDAFGRYENYLQRRKAAVDTTASFQREQRYLSEQAELLKHEESRRRSMEMRAYLERQMHDKMHAKAAAKLEARHDDLVRDGVTISTLPMENSIDDDEEAHVKLALKQTLDNQVARKAEAKREAQAAELEQQQHALNCVALEMQEKRTRDFVQKQEQAEVLQKTWQLQNDLRKIESGVERATRMGC